MSTDNASAPPATRTPGETPTPCECGHAHPESSSYYGPMESCPENGCDCREYRPAAPSSPPSPAVTAPDLGTLVQAVVDAVYEAAYRLGAGRPASDRRAAIVDARNALDAALSSLVEQTERAERERDEARATADWARQKLRTLATTSTLTGLTHTSLDHNDWRAELTARIDYARAALTALAAPTEEQTTHG